MTAPEPTDEELLAKLREALRQLQEKQRRDPRPNVATAIEMVEAAIGKITEAKRH